ncbi:TatD family hydrolase [Vagococcus lutrae LBD1]|uniref:TatD family hydrolase n=1 Tax=Vagococcus lutrae LBD1 TaxID=1408226 RepID=V6QAI0_9ENTE|nr:TatD family hydrolase [Vagococcus lutrae]EST89543.1 TatD family hydrolase [Vagococcus lutrae LBD1]
MIFDTHTHLNVPQFAEDLDETIARAHEYGVNEMAVVGFDQPTIEKSLQLSEKYPEIYSIIGWHPTEAGSYTPAVEKQLYQWFDSSDKIVALGEIGLDYYWMNDSKEVQTKVFRRQIAMAKELGLPFSVHTRDALADTYQVLKEEKVGAQGGIMHSFSGDWEWAQRFLDLGMMISLSGVVTFKKALEVKEVAKNVPLDALLVETDAPYLAPVPYRGKRNEPGYTSYVVDEIASLRGNTRDNIARQTRANAYRLFQLGEEYDASK